MTYGMGFSGLLVMLVMAVLLVVPFWKLLPKFGYSSWISLVAIIPLGALVLIWILAFSEPKPRNAA
ncbi:MAG: hypothetical protein WBA02_16425 [Jannaschia helgolandensis]|uniref:Uncharacterized protein n=1 Tax=Jannaschia helgolandensis TaxID=188906 RepID=A0A1H7HSB2_9RHOB|nr:hypothetical protein [Jannaschia helgolandensis]SEK53074.1 hypothetical protein SAMN04488526_0804 [Jannaschia helgolandensis]